MVSFAYYLISLELWLSSVPIPEGAVEVCSKGEPQAVWDQEQGRASFGGMI